MDPRELVIGLLAGTVGLVFGLVPGLLSSLTIAVLNFREELLFGASDRPHRLTDVEQTQRSFGLAVVGAAIIAFTVAAYVLH